MKWWDIGGVRENTRAATIMKIVYALAKEPLTKEGIHRAMGIHKGAVLDAALEVSTRKNLVYEHKPGRRYYSADDIQMAKAYGYTYYLLNWSHPDSKQLFVVYRDHTGWKYGWSSIYFTDYIEFLKMEKKTGLDKLDISKLYEAAGEPISKIDEKKDQATFKEKFKEFNRIGDDAVAIIKKRKAERDKEFPNAKPGVILKSIVLDKTLET